MGSHVTPNCQPQSGITLKTEGGVLEGGEFMHIQIITNIVAAKNALVWFWSFGCQILMYYWAAIKWDCVYSGGSGESFLLFASFRLKLSILKAHSAGTLCLQTKPLRCRWEFRGHRERCQQSKTEQTPRFVGV